MIDEPLSPRSVLIVQRAQQRLGEAADRAGRGRSEGWMGEAGYRRAEGEYDAVIELVPEWKAARAAARNMR